MADPLFQEWFHGRISRVEAEELLAKYGKRDGLFLLRESTASAGSYALSMCHNNKFIHYHIQRHNDGMVAIEDGKKFPGPVELVHHHQRVLDGLLTKLVEPCNRLPGVPPRVYSGANQEHIKGAAVAAMASMQNLQDVDEATATLMRAKLESAIGSVLHKNQPWFHSGISRDEAERRLRSLGCQEGMYLIREKEPGFALGLCHGGTVVHYLFDLDQAGRLSIKSGPKFDNLMLAVDHYTQREDGLLCKIQDPCRVELFEHRSRTFSRGSHSLDLPEVEPAATAGQASSRSFNDSEPFAGNPFLHRSSDVPDLISSVPTPSRRHFPPHLPSSGPAPLSAPPPVPARPPPLSPLSPVRQPFPNSMHHPAAFGNTDGARPLSGGAPSRGASFEAIYDSVKMKKSSFYFNQFKDIQTHRLRTENLKLEKELGFLLTLFGNIAFYLSTAMKVDARANCPYIHLVKPAADVQMISGDTYMYQLTQRPWYFEKSDWLSSLGYSTLGGHGNFGSVVKGEYTKSDGQTIPVAVKKLKSEEMNNPKSELMHEAEVMMKLDHPNIVRIIGLCQDETMMLVMELAPDGPLHKYLKKRKSFPMFKIFIILLQVAEGMQYLENMQFVHRDLAARNVLVVNEDFVKISDFGMSRAMGAGTDYYRAGKAGKWPLKWYAPECIYYRKFSSKGDVWSYGVTMWEATSYGKKPYEGLNGQLILEKIESGYRMECPEGVPPEVYKIMRDCWRYREEDRPTFQILAQELIQVLMLVKDRQGHE